MRTYSDYDARAITAMAIREGLIRTDEPCMICGAPQSQTEGGYASVVRHHPDLARRPLWTLPVCRNHHAQIHKGTLADPGLVAQSAARPRNNRAQAGA